MLIGKHMHAYKSIKKYYEYHEESSLGMKEDEGQGEEEVSQTKIWFPLM